MSAISDVSGSSIPYVNYIVDGTEEAAPIENQVEPVQAQEDEGPTNPNSAFFEGWSDDEIEQFKQNEKQQVDATISAMSENMSEGNDNIGKAAGQIVS